MVKNSRLLTTALPKTNETGKCVPYGNKTYLVCNSTRTITNFTRGACDEIFEIKSGHLICDSEKLLYILKFKVCGQVLYVGKGKIKFLYRFNNFKTKHRTFRKENLSILILHCGNEFLKQVLSFRFNLDNKFPDMEIL